MAKIKLALVSCGLGRVQRGFEVSCARWAKGLSDTSTLDVRLFCGGPFPNGTRISNFSRNGLAARTLRSLRLIHDGCRLEQISFGVGMLKSLLDWKPDVIWLQEYSLAIVLDAWRRWLGLEYRIVFCNGAPLGPDCYHRFDYIQHLSPGSYQDGISFGISENRMEVLPHYTPIVTVDKSRGELRRKYGFTSSDWIVLCVAAWNRHHKRIDYLIEEVSALDDANVRLFLCGEAEEETAALKEIGARKLGNRIRWMTLTSDEIFEAMSLCDVFVLPSLNEALGAVLIEAAMSGVPVLSHRHSAAEFILRDELWLENFSVPGNLSNRLRSWKHQPPSHLDVSLLRNQAVKRFSDQALAPRFESMIQRVSQKR